MFAGSDPRLRRAIEEIIAGFALINFGVVVAILAFLPSASNDRTATAVGAFVAAILGLVLAVGGANDLRK